MQERGCSFIDVKEQDAVTEKQALMVTDKDCQIHTIHPAVTREESSLSIRNQKKGDGPEPVCAYGLHGEQAAKPNPRSRITAREHKRRTGLIGHPNLDRLCQG